MLAAMLSEISGHGKLDSAKISARDLKFNIVATDSRCLFLCYFR